MFAKYVILFSILINKYTFAWNPNDYPFLPANADTSNIRKLIIDSQGPHKKILDVGCGLGYSTSNTPGSIGIDVNKRNIKKARDIFPDKTFRHSFINIKNSHEEYDIVTSMFFLHEVPQYMRKKIIMESINMAKERVVIVDIDPDYDATLSMSKNKPYLTDYFKNSRDDLKYFKETVLVKGLLNMWIYDKKDNDIIKTEYDIGNDIGYDIKYNVFEIDKYLKNKPMTIRTDNLIFA